MEPSTGAAVRDQSELLSAFAESALDGREWITTVPRVGYKFIGDVQVLDQSIAIKRRLGIDPLAAPDRPSIAVLPLAKQVSRTPWR